MTLKQPNLVFFAVTEWNNENMGVLNLAIPVVWEGLGRTVNKIVQKIKGVIFLNANLDPSQLKFTGANISKVNLIATGSQALDSPDRMKLCSTIYEISKELYQYKPVLIAIALNCSLSRITDEQLNDYLHIIPNRDDRKCQILLNYDRLHGIMD